MSEELRVKYLFVNLRYKNYVRLQVVIIAAWVVLAAAAYLAWGSSTSLLWSNLWMACLIAAVAEGIESKLAIDKAKAVGAGSG